MTAPRNALARREHHHHAGGANLLPLNRSQLARKIAEAMLSFELEQRFNKKQIFEM